MCSDSTRCKRSSPGLDRPFVLMSKPLPAAVDSEHNRDHEPEVELMQDPYEQAREEIFHRVVSGAGESDPTIRKAAASNENVPSDLEPLVTKIHEHAYKVTHGDLARLQPRYGDDKLFEIIVSAALGASRKRLLAGMAALEDA